VNRFRSLLRRRWVRWGLVVYAFLLIASHVWTGLLKPPPEPDARTQFVTVPSMNAGGEEPGAEPTRLGYRTWGAPLDADSSRPPLLLIHGSPSGGASDFDGFAPLLTDNDRRTVIAIDRPGFGDSDNWVPSYSLRANARLALALLDELGVRRAHVLGFSQGGGVGIWMDHFAPQRIASLALVASIGIQEGEGSGDYWFEHAKYALGYVGLVVLPEFLPHFDLLGPRDFRHAFIRDFWDTDQRPIRALLEDMDTPTLILHGRNDPLVPAWTAEEHHRLIESSRLVMMDASHFFALGPPMGDERATGFAADSVTWFTRRHDKPGVAPLVGVANFAPVDPEARSIGGFELPRSWPWWLLVIVLAVATLVSEDLTVIASGLLVATGQIDIAVALLGCYIGIIIGDFGLVLIGRFAGRRVLKWPFFRKALPERSLRRWEKTFDRHLAKTVFLSRMLPGARLPMYVAAGLLSNRVFEFMFWMLIAVALWLPVLMALTILIGQPIYGFFAEVFHGPWAIVASLAVLVVLIRIASYETTYSGRHKLAADLKRLTAYEFWPPFVFYIPLVLYLPALWLKRGGPMTFSCANPGMDQGGGIVGESKTDIIHTLERAAESIDRPGIILHARRIDPQEDHEARARRLDELVRKDERLGGYPVILKPEAAQRGVGVRVARSLDDVLDYCGKRSRAIQVQRYHPGPEEAGIFWSRVPTSDVPVDRWPGEIFSITRKGFPFVVGDGKHTLEHLIWEDKRLRMQADVFLSRFEDRLDDVLPAGEKLVLAHTGNHAQGARFSDGADLITPELTALIDELARAWRHPETGRRADFGRFDVRYETEQGLKQGRGIAVVEFNGVMSESTNLYDPERSLTWAYGVLFRQWRRLYDIGAARRAAGAEPTSIPKLLAMLRSHYKGKSPAPND
jgi:pimeloyl-ACP methyl ester carboxylesterase/membrane protein DedA with SNARE-associated domain